jgi:hypothetical protein
MASLKVNAPGYCGAQDTFYVGTLEEWGEFTSKG